MTRQTKRFLRTKEVLRRLGISRATLWRWERHGVIPPRRQLGPNAVGWLESTIDDFLESRPAVSSKQGVRGSDRDSNLADA